MKKCPWHPDAYSEIVFEYLSPPAEEIAVPASSVSYRREFRKCGICEHYFGDHGLDLRALYQGDYVNSTYGGEAGLKRTYDRVTSLPPEKSDNAQRVLCIREYLARKNPSAKRVLDVGSGTGVFAGAMKRAGFDCTGMDLDPRLASHLREHLGVNSLCGDFLTHAFEGSFDLITFNKVLEHIEYPVPFLRRANSLLSTNGLVYVELPDGPAAAAASLATRGHREEFDIDHFHAFSEESLRIFAHAGGFVPLKMERLVEPSGKFTLRGFLEPIRQEKLE